MPDPKVIAVSPPPFPRIGDDEPTQQLSGDGNAFFESISRPFWEIRPPPSSNEAIDRPPPSPPAGGTCPARRPCQTASPGAPQTDYPVYHDVSYYNPDVCTFVVNTLTGRTSHRDGVITSREPLGLLRLSMSESEIVWDASRAPPWQKWPSPSCPSHPLA